MLGRRGGLGCVSEYFLDDGNVILPGSLTFPASGRVANPGQIVSLGKPIVQKMLFRI
jgi:hypothetical protein